jgi:integrase
MMNRLLTPELCFRDAFEIWIAHRRISSNGIRIDASYIAPKTDRDYVVCAKALAKFFGRLPLQEIHLGHLAEYQRARALCDTGACKGGSGSWAAPAGANCIRKEVALLKRILKAARLWGEEEEECFQPLRAVETDVPRAMTPEEQHRFLHLAASREEWQFIYWYAIVALQTTASTNELRALRLGDILLHEPLIQIRRRGAKNKYRIRSIPLVSDSAVWALERLMERAREMGARDPHHFLFPLHITRLRYDPAQPMSESGLKKRWNQVRAAADLAWLRPYDLRHTGITRMAEAGTPIQVIMAFAGHMTTRMAQHYTTISMMSKRGWANAAWGADAGMPVPKKPVANQSDQHFHSAACFCA